MPDGLRIALTELFGDAVDDVEMVENLLVRAAAPRRPRNHAAQRILLRGRRASSSRDPTWCCTSTFTCCGNGIAGRMNLCDYLVEWVRHGYWSNRYERQARRFVDAAPRGVPETPGPGGSLRA